MQSSNRKPAHICVFSQNTLIFQGNNQRLHGDYSGNLPEKMVVAKKTYTLMIEATNVHWFLTESRLFKLFSSFNLDYTLLTKLKNQKHRCGLCYFTFSLCFIHTPYPGLRWLLL